MKKILYGVLFSISCLVGISLWTDEEPVEKEPVVAQVEVEEKAAEPKEEVVVKEEEPVEEEVVVEEEEELEAYSYEYYSTKDQNLRLTFTVFYGEDGEDDEIVYFYQNDTAYTAGAGLASSGQTFEIGAFEKDGGRLYVDLDEFPEFILFFDEGFMAEEERTERFNLVENVTLNTYE